MRTSRLIVPLAVTASLATAGTASAAPKPHAQLKGGDAPPIIPSLVQTRIARTERALDRLSQYVDDQDSARVVKVSKVIRRQTTAAWRGAKYILRTAPPPVVSAVVSLRLSRADASIMLGLFSFQLLLPTAFTRLALALVFLVLAADVLVAERRGLPPLARALLARRPARGPTARRAPSG